MSITKKVFAVMLSVFIVLSIAGCQNSSQQTETGEPKNTVQTVKDASAVTILSSDATAELIEKMKAENTVSPMAEERFPLLLTTLQNRTKQDYPQVDTTYTQKHTVIADNDVYYLDNDQADSVVLYLHGGAYTFEISQKQIVFCDKLARKLNAKVYMPLYPLAPQATYREAYAFLDAVYEKVLTEDKPVYLTGDSAGGGLALGFAEYLRDKGVQLPNKMVLLSPWVDVTMSDPDTAEYEKIDPHLKNYGLIECGKLWAGDTDTKDPLTSPLFGDVKNLPPTLIFTGTGELMCPDDTKLYRKMKEAGVECLLVYGEGLWHDFVIEDIPESAVAVDMIVDFCR